MPIYNYYKKACNNHYKNKKRYKKAFLKNIKARFKKM